MEFSLSYNKDKLPVGGKPLWEKKRTEIETGTPQSDGRSKSVIERQIASQRGFFSKNDLKWFTKTMLYLIITAKTNRFIQNSYSNHLV